MRRWADLPRANAVGLDCAKGRRSGYWPLTDTPAQSSIIGQPTDFAALVLEFPDLRASRVYGKRHIITDTLDLMLFGGDPCRRYPGPGRCAGRADSGSHKTSRSLAPILCPRACANPISQQFLIPLSHYFDAPVHRHRYKLMPRFRYLQRQTRKVSGHQALDPRGSVKVLQHNHALP